MSHDDSVDRRAVLKSLGAGSVAFALAGCTGDGGETETAGGGGDGTETPTESMGGGMTDTEAMGGTTTGTAAMAGEIVPGTAPGFPPFEIKQDGELTGFDVELVEAVVAETNYELGTWQEFEFDALIPAVRNDKIDMIAAAMTITEQRKNAIAFSDPYYSADQSVIVQEGGDFQPTELADLSGRVVGAQKGTTGEGVVQSELIETGQLQQSNYKAYDNYTLAVQDLENGNVDAVVLDKPVADTFAAQRAVTVAFVYETGERYGFGLRKSDDARLQAVNQGLATVMDNGTFEDLRNKWFGADSG